MKLRLIWILAVLVIALPGCASDDLPTGPIQTVEVQAASVEFEVGMDWPQWRGSKRDGAVSETVRPWAEQGPLEVWRQPIGDGYSGMSVADGRLYTLDQKDAEYLVALDITNGQELWRFRSDSRYRDGQGDGPRGTPAFDSGRVYSVGAKGMFHAVDAASGKLLWSHNLTGEFRASRPGWGYSTSPLVLGSTVFVEPGGGGGKSLAAFDKVSGALKWSSYSDAAGYSSPIAATLAGVPHILFFTSKHLVGVSPDDGTVYWDYPWSTSYDVNAATPVVLPNNRVFISSNYDVGGAVLQINGSQPANLRPEVIWKNREMRNHFNSSVLFEGHLYGFDNGTLKCVSAANGELQWRQRGFGKGSLILAGRQLIILGERGHLALAEANPEAYQELARAQVLRGRCWTSPTLAGGKLYLRNQSEIVCLNLGG